jgi:RimJ/RimL family protein N-acetyltransferase
MMQASAIELVPLDSKNSEVCEKFAAFVNRNYNSPLPVSARSLQREGQHYFWAQMKESREIVGATGFVQKTAKLAETVKTVIALEFRGEGLGVLLSQLIEDEVKRQGFKKVMTTIYITNLPMIFIKLKQGYRFEGFHPDHEAPGLHEYSLGKVFE